ncbi:hypothetical protein K443DRAFT_11564 [Laccaria amethystina LaAM-08-1]|uniref:Uncharacterized protein n=1 Tax=Laccaria amethystina LaAM-08-1 TaxID=1095629 RepID=A0A0C9X1J9_9AGAR|nr:hypothetical protein K443DRAFT_11564 [Laccaria amethystina LaAM-08-1]
MGFGLLSCSHHRDQTSSSPHFSSSSACVNPLSRKGGYHPSAADERSKRNTQSRAGTPSFRSHHLMFASSGWVTPPSSMRSWALVDDPFLASIWLSSAKRAYPSTSLASGFSYFIAFERMHADGAVQHNKYPLRHWAPTQALKERWETYKHLPTCDWRGESLRRRDSRRVSVANTEPSSLEAEDPLSTPNDFFPADQSQCKFPTCSHASAKTTYTNGSEFTKTRLMVAPAQRIVRSTTPAPAELHPEVRANLEGTREVVLELVFR